MAPGLVRKALASGTVPVASRLSLYEELVGDGERGLLFPPGDAITLAGQLERLIAEPRLRRELVGGGRDAVPDWGAVVGQLEDIYLPLCARRHDPRGNPALRGRLSRRRSIHVDLHMHTDHSPDCATPVEVLLATARDRGLGAIAITDHNEISGALAAREVAEQMGGIKVIVAEEVKTAEQGEVIGLFLEQKIPRGMTMAETIAEIRRQGGLVYVPHPFDRLHSVPDYEHLLAMVEEIDILEVFNPRVALTAFNEEAERFAAKYRIVPGAGSDSHVAQGLGSVMIRVHDFEGPEEFLEAMRDADIVRKHKNLIYVQALKLLQTSKASGARRAGASVGARPVKGGRPRTRRSAASRRARSRRAARQAVMHAEGAAPGPSKKALARGPATGAKRGAGLPTTDDEIQEKYLERAIRELNELTHRLQECSHCPRGNLMPVLGSGHPQADVFLLKFAPTAAEIEEGVAFYGRAGNALRKSFKRLNIDPAGRLRDALRQVPGLRPVAGGRGVRRAHRRGAGDRAAANDRGDGRARPGDPQRGRRAALEHARAAPRGDPGADADDRRPVRPRDRRVARLGGVQARVLGGLPRARRLVRGPAAVLASRPTRLHGMDWRSGRSRSCRSAARTAARR